MSFKTNPPKICTYSDNIYEAIIDPLGCKSYVWTIQTRNVSKSGQYQRNRRLTAHIEISLYDPLRNVLSFNF